MKRTDLEKIDGLSKEQIDSILGLHQEDVKGWNSKLADQKTEIDNKIKEIETLTQKVRKYDGVDVEKLKNDITEWEKKYNEDMAKKDKDYAMKSYFKEIPFASELARKQAMKEFDEKNLPFENGAFLGADDFINNLKKSDPRAFVDDSSQGNNQGNQQSLTTGIELKKGGNNDNDDPITRRFKELNPNIKI